MIFTKFKLFVEARLSDVLNIKGDSELASELKRKQDTEFDFSQKLTKFVTLKRRIGNKKIQFEILWYNTATHSILKRIKDRTSFVSVEEFNELFKSSINQILPEKIGKEIFTGRYSMYSSEYNLSIIFNFNIDDFSNGKYQLSIITILPGKKGDKIFNIN
jgi:hypothetical protein